MYYVHQLYSAYYFEIKISHANECFVYEKWTSNF